MNTFLKMFYEYSGAIISTLACIISISSDILYIKILSCLITIIEVIKIILRKIGINDCNSRS